MTDQNRKCIYCPQQDASRFRGVEHVIPQSFGTFGGQSTLPQRMRALDNCARKSPSGEFSPASQEGMARTDFILIIFGAAEHRNIAAKFL